MDVTACEKLAHQEGNAIISLSILSAIVAVAVLMLSVMKRVVT
jgi:hypothetical protein